jgi:lysozyme family protein
VTDDVFVALAARDPKTLVAAFNDERLAFLKRVSTWPVFGKGWARRVAEVRAVSLAMASAAGGSAKPAAPAEMPAHKPTGLKIRRALIGAVGAAIAIIAHRIVDGGAATVIAIALVTIACGAGWWLWRRRKAKFSEAP